MTVEYIAAGDTVPIAVRVMLAGVGVDSTATATVKIQRRSDGLWLNTSTETFAAYNAGTAHRSLVAVTNDLSRYVYAWDTSTIINPVASDVYLATIEVTAPYAYSETGEISTALIPTVRSGLALASAVTTLQTGVTTLLNGVTLAAGVASTVASTVWAVTDGTMTKGAALDLLRRRVTNKRLLTALGVLRFYADDGVTIEKTSTVADVNGTAVSPATGEASQASAEA